MKKDTLRRAIITNLKKYGAQRITLFGSYARNEHTKQSDCDLIVDFKPKKSFLELVQIERELSEKSGVKIDLLTRKSLSPRIMNNIKNDMEVIYG